MASRKKLKKEINYLHSELLSDCFAYLQFNNIKDSSTVENIINELADSHYEVFTEINKATRGMSRKDVKERYSKIIQLTVGSTNKLYSDLSNLPRI